MAATNTASSGSVGFIGQGGLRRLVDPGEGPSPTATVQASGSAMATRRRPRARIRGPPPATPWTTTGCALLHLREDVRLIPFAYRQAAALTPVDDGEPEPVRARRDRDEGGLTRLVL